MEFEVQSITKLFLRLACESGHFGTNCELSCDCVLDRKCNKNYSNCLCKASNTSSACRDICKCRNLCPPGWIGEFRSKRFSRKPPGNQSDLSLIRHILSLKGKNCSERCPKNFYGRLCSQKCTCLLENTKECNPEDGFCVCERRFYGVNCERSTLTEQLIELIPFREAMESRIDRFQKQEREEKREAYKFIILLIGALGLSLLGFLICLRSVACCENWIRPVEV